MHTILQRTSPELLTEIVLVDDNAEEELFYPLRNNVDKSKLTKYHLELHEVPRPSCRLSNMCLLLPCNSCSSRLRTSPKSD